MTGSPLDIPVAVGMILASLVWFALATAHNLGRNSKR